ncbi:MAG: hypothetical protein M3R31_01705 [Pseudomonadota bacterium]|nr:hypothetical protein [Pseudomonadota bacterium]
MHASPTSFTSEIYIDNPNATSTEVFFVYYGGLSSATPGLRFCPAMIVPAQTTIQISLAALCPGLNPGSNFGMLRVIVTGLPRPINAYARVNSASGQGFSIEGFPAGSLTNSDGDSRVLGLKRIAAAPGYQTNCFVGAQNEPVNVTITLYSAGGVQIGSPKALNLAAYDLIRILDIFGPNGVNAPAGDYFNVRAHFGLPWSPGPSFVGFCTVQNNTSFDADFRIAKSFSDRNDEAKQFSPGILSNVSAPNGYYENWRTFIQHPDQVACALTGVVDPNSAEMRLLDPFGFVVAGGNNVESFPETYLGLKSERNAGSQGLWTVQVGSNGIATLKAYLLTCTSGNGMSKFIYGGTTPGTF